MVTPPEETTADPYIAIEALRQQLTEGLAERDAALAEKAELAKAIAGRNEGQHTEYQTAIVKIETLRAEVGELRAAQAAGLKVLQAMVASPGQTQPVFDLIARQAAELCVASAAAVAMLDDTTLHLATQYGYDPEFASVYASQFPRPVGSETVMGRAILSHRVEQIGDLAAEPGFMARAPGRWSTMAVPLLRGGAPLGVIAVGRPTVGRFPENQVTLLQTFAEQAVIAITSAETYRALQTRTSDLQESLAYQTATSDVLKVISRSTFDLQPVLDTVVEIACRLCDADQAFISRRSGELWRMEANRGFPPEYEEYNRVRGAFRFEPDSPSVAARTAREGRVVHIEDVAAVPGYPEAFFRLGKHRTSLGVPLLRNGETVGLIQLARQRVEPFTNHQIELVSTFAISRDRYREHTTNDRATRRAGAADRDR